MTRVATAENEEDLVHVARDTTAAQLERICRGMRQVERDEGRLMDEPLVYDPTDRDVFIRADADGSTRVTMRVHRDEAAKVMAVLDRVRSALRAQAGGVATPDRADALLRMAQLAERALEREAHAAECAERVLEHEARATERTSSVQHPMEAPPRIPLSAESGGPNSTEAPLRVPAETRRPTKGATPPRNAPAEAARPEAGGSRVPAETPRAKTGADHALVAFHIQPEMLAEGFTALLDDGTRVPAETFRRVACDCSLAASLQSASGEVLDVGRRSRTISPALRRALNRRDEGCRFPGCECTRFVHAHHLEHWADGGETSLGNLVSLCPFHHRLVHEAGYGARRDGEEGVVFTTPDGTPIPHVPAETPLTGTLHALTGPLPIDDDPSDNLHWIRRPDYGYVVHAMVSG